MSRFVKIPILSTLDPGRHSQPRFKSMNGSSGFLPGIHPSEKRSLGSRSRSSMNARSPSNRGFITPHAVMSSGTKVKVRPSSKRPKRMLLVDQLNITDSTSAIKIADPRLSAPNLSPRQGSMERNRTKKRSLRLPSVKRVVNAGVGSGAMASYQSTKSSMQTFTNRKISKRQVRPRGVEVSGMD